VTGNASNATAHRVRANLSSFSDESMAFFMPLYVLA
jgi:isopenicillin N synthase-like dioxygenase